MFTLVEFLITNHEYSRVGQEELERVDPWSKSSTMLSAHTFRPQTMEQELSLGLYSISFIAFDYN